MKIQQKDLIKMKQKAKFELNDYEINYIEERLNKIFKNCEKLKLIEKQKIEIDKMDVEDLREDVFINTNID